MTKFSFPKQRAVQGFSLVELAVVIVVIGLVMGSMMTMLGPYLQSTRYDATQERLTKIARALSVYAQQYNRLPCPASPNPNPATDEPFGAPRRSGINGTTANAECVTGGFVASAYIGLVPFRALGLSEDEAKDGFGNFITYEVAPMVAGSGSATYVHEQCRTAAWIDGLNKNPGKALFCCPQAILGYSTIKPIVYDDVSGLNPLFNGIYNASIVPALPYGLNTAPPAVPATPAVDNQFIAYVLVSHGQNGDNVFIKNAITRRPVTAGLSQERWNGFDTLLRNVARPISTKAGTNYFDDVVIWRTPNQVMSELGDNSCTRP